MKEFIYTDQSVDAAIEKGLKDLGLKEEQVKIEVTEAGSNGFFGLFKKEATIKLTPLDENYIKNNKKEKNEEKVTNEIKKQEVAEEKEKIVEQEIEKVEEQEEIVEKQINEVKQENIAKKEYKEDLIIANKEKIVEYIEKIVHSMGFKDAIIKFEYNGGKNYTLRVTNVDNSSLLIGKRGITLNALQVLAENFAKRYSKNYYRIHLDCDDYRENRKETLEELAINMAKKSKKLGKPVELEPMTSSERKIIHKTLKEIKNVETESVGKEPHRYLIITAK